MYIEIAFVRAKPNKSNRASFLSKVWALLEREGVPSLIGVLLSAIRRIDWKSLNNSMSNSKEKDINDSSDKMEML